MTNTYKLLQLTNNSIVAVPIDSYIPLGRVTRRINAPVDSSSTFSVTSSNADTVQINDVGFYKVTYSLTATAAAEGVVTVALVANGESIYTVSQYVGAADSGVNLTLPYTIRVCSSCSSDPTSCPVSIQIQNTGVALTGETANLIIEKI
jgi:hypothetical protein